MLLPVLGIVRQLTDDLTVSCFIPTRDSSLGFEPVNSLSESQDAKHCQSEKQYRLKYKISNETNKSLDDFKESFNN